MIFEVDMPGAAVVIEELEEVLLLGKEREESLGMLQGFLAVGCAIIRGGLVHADINGERELASNCRYRSGDVSAVNRSGIPAVCSKDGCLHPEEKVAKVSSINGLDVVEQSAKALVPDATVVFQ